MVKNEKKVKTINLNNRMKYTNPDYDITILELREDKDDIHEFLELDDIIIENILDNNINKDSNQVFIGETIYIIQYPEGKLSVSYNILNAIYEDKKYNFNHFCSTKNGSSGSPILNISSNKIIGIHS
jgi:V8-like Glu-specific endopeptidase